MPNQHFQFKQFTVFQQHCAMKVCTDSCLFGAWVAQQMVSNKTDIRSVLDIGAGTGLLSLMLAQQLPGASFDAVEIDPAAAAQAKLNFDLSPWQSRLHSFHSRIQDFIPGKTYDLIICNPPFYHNDLKGENGAKNAAHHNTELILTDLFLSAVPLLSPSGFLTLLLPYHRTKEAEDIGSTSSSFFTTQNPRAPNGTCTPFSEACYCLQQIKIDAIVDDMSIKDKEGAYTPAFIALLKAYYLYL